jgi:hypothetical protein
MRAVAQVRGIEELLDLELHKNTSFEKQKMSTVLALLESELNLKFIDGRMDILQLFPVASAMPVTAMLSP